MRDDLVGSLQRPLEVFAAAVVLVLLIACANVANLTLTRGAARRREIAVRTAFGAGRGRIVRQLVTESLLLSALAACSAPYYGLWGPSPSPRLPERRAVLHPLGVNVPTLVFAAIVSLIAGLAFGIIPAFRATDGSLDLALREGGRGGSDGPSQRTAAQRDRRRRAGALGHAHDRRGAAREELSCAASTKLGFEEKGILSFRVTLPSAKYETPDSRRRVLRNAAAATGGAAGGRVGRTGAGHAVQRLERAVRPSWRRVASAEARSGLRHALPVRIARRSSRPSGSASRGPGCRTRS